MKALIWTSFAVIAAFWTGFAAFCSAIAGWIAASLTGASIEQATAAVSAFPLADLLAPWVPPALVAQVEAVANGAVDMAVPLLASSGWLLTWLSPLVWLAWGAGALLLLVGAGVLHWMAASQGSPPRTGSRRP